MNQWPSRFKVSGMASSDTPTGLHSWIRSNDGRSLVLFIVFLLALQTIVGLNLFFPLAVFDPGHAPLFSWGGYFTRYAPLVLIGSGVWFGWEFFWHIESVKKASGFSFIDEHDEPRLCSIIQPLITIMGLPVPFVGIIESPARNAFACGIARKKAVVVVTRGLIDSLNNDELAAVLAHELSHIKNGDIRLMAAANIFMTRLQVLHKNNPLKFTPIHVVLAFAIPVILPLTLAGTFIAHIVLRAGQVSRLMIASSREYIADAEAVQLTQNPAAFASALLKVGHNYRIDSMRREDDAMMIAGDTEGDDATHPTVAQRVAALARTTGSMVFNAPGAIGEEQWAAVPALREARAAAQLQALPKANFLARLRSGSKVDIFGFSMMAKLMLLVTVVGLAYIHFEELGSAKTMAAKFDARPLSFIVGAPLGCMIPSSSDSAKAICKAGEGTEVYKEFEGQKNTLAGWLADTSKRRKKEGYINPKISLTDMDDNAKFAEFKGLSGRLNGVTAAMRGNDFIHKKGAVFVQGIPQGITIAELDQVGCFDDGIRLDDQPEGKYRLDEAESLGGWTYAKYMQSLRSEAEILTQAGVKVSDAQLRNYVSRRQEWMFAVVYNLWGLPGLRAMQNELLSGPHPALVERLRERMKDTAFNSTLSPLEAATYRALVRNPRDFVPCLALRHIPIE
jgi:Zn-dependent protease with chaperone function